MTGRDDDRPDEPQPDDVSGAPVDFDRLDVIEARLSTDERFVRVESQPEFAPDRLVCVYAPRLYPNAVSDARLELTWFENGDFSVHYHEDNATGEFDHRWDRHPSAHNAREHVHPGPDAPTPGTDTSHPDDWRDVLSSVLREVETRQRQLWDG